MGVLGEEFRAYTAAAEEWFSVFKPWFGGIKVEMIEEGDF
jgi:hypothetical protein